jgi:hypothetical protein
MDCRMPFRLPWRICCGSFKGRTPVPNAAAKPGSSRRTRDFARGTSIAALSAGCPLTSVGCPLCKTQPKGMSDKGMSDMKKIGIFVLTLAAIYAVASGSLAQAAGAGGTSGSGTPGSGAPGAGGGANVPVPGTVPSTMPPNGGTLNTMPTTPNSPTGPGQSGTTVPQYNSNGQSR